MRYSIYKLLLAAVLTGAFLAGCRKWDDHNAVTDPALTKNLYQQISENPSLSTFAGLLVKSGYDKIIASSKTFTVFAPSNTALAGLDAAIVNDSARLRAFVENHIATQSYYTTGAADTMRLQMLNGKYHNFRNKTVADATIVEADKQAKNGVVQVIDKPLPVVRNTWETIENDPTIPAAQKAYLLSLFGKMQDLTNAVQIGVNSNGLPIYQPGTDSITTNRFWRNVYDLRDESRQYTLFVLDDAAWASEVNKFNPYYATGTADSTTNLSSWTVVKDLALEGIYTPKATTDTVVSRFGVKMPVDPSAIVRTIKTSNGVIYVMNKMDVQPRHKLQSIVIEAENYRATSHDRRGNTFFRDRNNPLTGKDFRDVLVYNHGVSSGFNLNYRLSAVPSGKYRAYWVAVNDFLAAGFNQKLAIGSPTSTTFPYTAVPFNNFAEVYIGEFTLATYQNFLDIYLVAATSSTATVSPLTCDYIRLEPVF